MHQSFLNLERFRYAWYAGLLTLAAGGAYLVDSGQERPSGGTIVGYILGGLAVALILFLMGYGIRRRSFFARAGTTKRWLSLHIYFGLSAPLLATLHTGFHFGFNVHTLAYVLLWLVAASGGWGVYAYARYPQLMARERGAVAREVLLTRLAEVDRETLSLAADCEAEVRDLIADAIERTRLGGGVWAQLRARDDSMLLVAPVRTRGFAALVPNRGQDALISQLALYQSTAQARDTQHTLHQLLQLSSEKAVVLRRLQRDIQLQGLLKFWLYIHLPLSFGLLAAIAVHIFAVFFYW
jgi:hypothetical protein